MPSTRPGLMFDDDGVCQACANYEKRKHIDWDKRHDELADICDDYRRDDGYYDCIIPVSGGKDSHFLTYMMSERFDMNPLLVTVGAPFSTTDAGAHDLRNLKETFGCDHMQFDMSHETFRTTTRAGFEKLGEPLRFVEAAIYVLPILIAMRFDVPFVMYGENSGYEYGLQEEESMLAMEDIQATIESIDIEFWRGQEGIDDSMLNAVKLPSDLNLVSSDIEPMYMSYFVPWNGYKNFKIARENGFKSVRGEWERPGHIESYDQIDSVGYIIHNWMKYPKFGFARTTDILCRHIRWGLISRKAASRLVMERDGKLDQVALDDFCDFCGYTQQEFYDIANRWYNQEIFEFDERLHEWNLKDPIWRDLPTERSGVKALDGVDI
jgi:N-acetyl sugar amidotransferase